MEREIHNSLGFNINVLSHFIQNVYNEKLGEYGLTHSQAKVVHFLAKHGRQTQSELQNKLFIKASSMNGVIESLLKHDRISKESSLSDKRTKVITLTGEGEKLYEIIWKIIENIESDVGQGFSNEEQKVIVSWLQKMQSNVKPYTSRGD